VITHFATIEADFQREYRIDLGVEVWWMPWRRFITLLRGLSARSGWYQLARAKAKGPRKISGAQVDAYFQSLGS
jgi:hypothetical protein